jgi:hypothetical protein
MRFASGIGDAAGKNGNATGRTVSQALYNAVHLIERHHGRDIDLDAALSQAVDQRGGALATRVGDGDFHVDVVAPGSNPQGLLLHLVEVVGENFEGKGPVGNRMRQVAAEGFVVGDAGLPHQGRVGGKAADPGIPGQIENRLLVGAIGENLDLHAGDTVRHIATPFEPRARSSWPPHVASEPSDTARWAVVRDIRNRRRWAGNRRAVRLRRRASGRRPQS